MIDGIVLAAALVYVSCTFTVTRSASSVVRLLMTVVRARCVLAASKLKQTPRTLGSLG